MVCAWFVVRWLHSNALHANRPHTVAFSIRKTIGRNIKSHAGHFASKVRMNWAALWWRLVIFQRKVLFSLSRLWLSVRNGASMKRKKRRQLFRVWVAFGPYSSINIAAPSSYAIRLAIASLFNCVRCAIFQMLMASMFA